MGKGLMGSMDRAIGDLIKNPGMPGKVYDQAKGSLLAANKSGLQSAIQRRAGEGSSRGLFDSGLTQQGFQGIESDYQGRYMDALTQLDMQNAQMAMQGLGLGSSHLLGKRQISSQQQMHAASLALQGELGRGQLGLGHSQAATARAWQEFQMNMMAQQYAPMQNATNAIAGGIPTHGGGPIARGGGRAF